jgi:hypothetical protein
MQQEGQRKQKQQHVLQCTMYCTAVFGLAKVWLLTAYFSTGILSQPVGTCPATVPFGSFVRGGHSSCFGYGHHEGRGTCLCSASFLKCISRSVMKMM